MKSFAGLLILPFFAQVALPQENKSEVILSFVGHATTLIESNGVRIMTDPFFGKKILFGLKRRIPPAIPKDGFPRIDIILVSHTHPDHIDKNFILKSGANSLLIMPWGRGREYKKKGIRVVELHPWEKHEEKGVLITAVPAKHMYGHCLGYLIQTCGMKFYFSGDTKWLKGLENLQKENIDVMLAPYDGFPIFGSIWTADQVIRAIGVIGPRYMIPVHWGSFRRWWTTKQEDPPDVFLEHLKQKDPNTEGIMMKVGDSINFEAGKKPSFWLNGQSK